jgi:hypothetical protein
MFRAVLRTMSLPRYPRRYVGRHRARIRLVLSVARRAA